MLVKIYVYDLLLFLTMQFSNSIKTESKGFLFSDIAVADVLSAR